MATTSVWLDSVRGSPCRYHMCGGSEYVIADGVHEQIVNCWCSSLCRLIAMTNECYSMATVSLSSLAC